MYDWYFGKHRTPSDLREARAQMALTFTGAGLFVILMIALGGLWLGGVI